MTIRGARQVAAELPGPVNDVPSSGLPIPVRSSSRLLYPRRMPAPGRTIVLRPMQQARQLRSLQIRTRPASGSIFRELARAGHSSDPPPIRRMSA